MRLMATRFAVYIADRVWLSLAIVKLTNLGALIFRILGALFLIAGLPAVTEGILDLLGQVDANVASESEFLLQNLFFFAIGFCMIYFSKKIAALFCRGLED